MSWGCGSMPSHNSKEGIGEWLGLVGAGGEGRSGGEGRESMGKVCTGVTRHLFNNEVCDEDPSILDCDR